MKISAISPTSFGIYKQSQKTAFGEKLIGKFKNKSIEIITSYKPRGDIDQKLYYIKIADQWLKSKLNFFQNGKCIKTIRSYANDRSL